MGEGGRGGGGRGRGVGGVRVVRGERVNLQSIVDAGIQGVVAFLLGEEAREKRNKKLSV